MERHHHFRRVQSVRGMLADLELFLIAFVAAVPGRPCLRRSPLTRMRPECVLVFLLAFARSAKQDPGMIAAVRCLPQEPLATVRLAALPVLVVQGSIPTVQMDLRRGKFLLFQKCLHLALAIQVYLPRPGLEVLLLPPPVIPPAVEPVPIAVLGLAVQEVPGRILPLFRV